MNNVARQIGGTIGIAALVTTRSEVAATSTAQQLTNALHTPFLVNGLLLLCTATTVFLLLPRPASPARPRAPHQPQPGTDDHVTPFTTDQLLAALDAAMSQGDRLHGAFAICVVDDGGHPIAQLRHPEATVAATDSALSKARTSIWLGADTGAVPAAAPIVPALVSGLPWPVNIFPGGRVIRDGARRVGAIGVGGSTDPADDAQVAAAALQVLSPAQ